jgi:hypothetical protein
MFSAIMEIFALIAHLLSTAVRVAGPGGVRAVIAESRILKHQLIVLNRARKRAPRLTRWDRLLFGIGAFWVAPNRLPKIAIGIRPSTLLRFHRALIQRKYRLLFTPRARQRPGPKGPSKQLIAAILEMKRRNPRFGCPRIAQRTLRALLSPVRRTTDRHQPARVSGPPLVLEPTRSSAQARPIRSLLQSSARPQRAHGENSGRTARPCCAPNRPAAAVLLASTLSWPFPHTGRRLISNSPWTGYW